MTSNSKTGIAIDEVIRQLQAVDSMPDELLEIFSEEAEDHLRTIYEGLGRLQEKNGDAEALAAVRRASHTLKGAAGAVNLQSATRLAHRMEDLLDKLAEGNESVTENSLKLLLATADQLQGLTTGDFDVNVAAPQIVDLYRRYVTEMGEPECQQTPPLTVSAIPSPRKSEQVQSSSSAPAVSGKFDQYLRVPLHRLDELVGLLGEMVVNRSEFQQRLDDFESRIEDMQSAMERLREVAQQVESRKNTDRQKREQNLKQHDRRQALDSPRRTINKFEGHANEFDLLEFEQYDEFYLLSQTLAEADKDAEIMSGEFRTVKSTFDSLLRCQQQLHRDAQNSLMKIRMVPLTGIVSRLERTVRTVAEKLNRKVQLDLVGERIELDKTVLDTIADPILHLIRNAIGHGIEDAEARAALGKPETAKLCVQAVNHGTQLTLRISDDGAGINLEKVRQKAIEKQLIHEGQELNREELHALIFLPGFSMQRN